MTSFKYLKFYVLTEFHVIFYTIKLMKILNLNTRVYLKKRQNISCANVLKDHLYISPLRNHRTVFYKEIFAVRVRKNRNFLKKICIHIHKFIRRNETMKPQKHTYITCWGEFLNWKCCRDLRKLACLLAVRKLIARAWPLSFPFGKYLFNILSLSLAGRRPRCEIALTQITCTI